MLCVGQPLEVPGAKEIPSGGATDKVAGSAYNLCPCESQLPVHMRKPDYERWLRIKSTPKLPPEGTLSRRPGCYLSRRGSCGFRMLYHISHPVPGLVLTFASNASDSF